MAFLPKGPLTLTGGCYCKAVRYMVQVPSWEERPLVPGALDTPISSNETVETRMPLINIDHCNTCRQVSGAIVQCWLICPAGWVEWDLLVKDEVASAVSEGEKAERVRLGTLEAVGPMTLQTKPPPRTYLALFSSSDRATRSFCSRCGTNLSYVSHKRAATPLATVDVATGSLDKESLELAKPDRHGWFDYGVGWVKHLLQKGDGGFLIRHHTGDVSRAVEDA